MYVFDKTDNVCLPNKGCSKEEKYLTVTEVTHSQKT